MKTIYNAEKESRTIFNPVLKDTVVFLETSRETCGEHTLVEVTLAGGGGNPAHFHDNLSEEFTCFSGELSLEVNGKTLRLLPGQSAVAPAGSKHRFFNRTKQDCHFKCRVTPGSPGFEQMLQITYGMTRDGLMNKHGMPQNALILGYIFMISGTRLTGLISAVEPLLKWFGKRAIRKGIAADLQRRYITIH